MTDAYCAASLLYYFWLPSGKDEFGFDDEAGAAPLTKTAEYRRNHPHEETIARRLRNQMKALQGNHPDLAGLTWTGELVPRDGDLGLRKLQYAFEYRHVGTALARIAPDGPLRGDALMLSNGLYLWRFELEYKSGTTDENLHAAATDFLKNDFIQRYVRKILGLGWPSPDADQLREYAGILTYYQLDLLLNGLFDGTAHPHAFLPSPEKPKNKHLYSLDEIIRSGSLYALEGQHEPLFDKRKRYTLRGDQSERPIDTSLNVFDHKVNRYSRELLLSRLSYAAMEQFLRVSISFGIIYYKAGLAHCRAELVDRSLLTRINRRSGEQFQQGRFYAEGISAAYKVATWAPPTALILVTIAFVWWMRRRAKDQQRQLTSPSVNETRTMVLDYSFLNRLVDAPNGAHQAVNEISNALRDLKNAKPIASRGMSTFRETPASGVERIKYSIESDVAEGISYILHIEIDQRWESSEEQLRDVRLVVRLPRDFTDDITHSACRVIAAGVRELVLNRADDATKNEYFRNHFGWTNSTLWSGHQS